MKIAVVFDSPYTGWENRDHKKEMEAQIHAWGEEEPEAEYQIGDALATLGHDIYFVGVVDDFAYMFDRLAQFAPDLVFNCSEAYHKDATLDYLFPAMLDAAGYRYTGAPPLGLLLTRNKAMSKKVLAYHDIRVPGFVTYRLSEDVDGAPELKFPLIVKPLQMDASVGISQASVVQDVAALGDRVAFIHEKFSQPAIAEELIDGRELYVGILGNGATLDILPIIELVFDKELTKPEERIATKSAKWDEPYRKRKGIRSVFARPISRQARAAVAETCRTAYRACWLHDYARLDVRVTPNGEVWVIEVNANPVLAYEHEMARAAEKAGLVYSAFIDRIVKDALQRYEQQA